MNPELSKRLQDAKQQAIWKKTDPRIILDFASSCSSIGKFSDLSAKWQSFVREMESNKKQEKQG
jgi:hypothetical protein